MTSDLQLLPVPRSVRVDAGHVTARAALVTEDADELFRPAVAALRRGVSAAAAPPLPVIFTRSSGSTPPQHYTLTIEPAEVRITAADAAGAFYAVQTLLQLARTAAEPLPCLHIEDHPDIAVRGFMLDISRDKVPTQATLLALVDKLASWKFNQLQLYTEHTFAYAGHEDVWRAASPMTAEEIRELDHYCADRCIELVPNQNSFGHMERWLTHDRYRHLAEAPDGAETPWGYYRPGPFSLCPTDPASLELLSDLFGQLLPNFSSRLFNVGCDETFDIGQGRSATECAARGTTAVYVEFLNKVHRLVESHGRRMQFWGDIIVKHPEHIARLPTSAIALEWGYEADHPFDEDARAFADAGLDFYLCPGTSSWNSFAGRTDNAIANLRSAARSAIEHRAAGYLITDWGDNGHLQYLPASYTAIAAGAAFSWCLSTNDPVRIPAAMLDGMAVPWAELGNVYRLEISPARNGSRLFRILVPPPNDEFPERHLTGGELNAIASGIDAAIAPTSQVTGLVADELRNTAAMMRHAVAVARRKLGLPGESPAAVHERWQHITAEHRRVWLARNRPGGLDDSLRRIAP